MSASVFTLARQKYLTEAVPVEFRARADPAAVRPARLAPGGNPAVADHVGLDASQASLLYGLSGAIDMLVFYPAGKIMDRRGRLGVALPSTLTMGTALMLVPLTAGFTGLLLVVLLVRFGNGISSGLVMTLGAGVSLDNGRGQFLGLWRFIADAG